MSGEAGDQEQKSVPPADHVPPAPASELDGNEARSAFGDHQSAAGDHHSTAGATAGAAAGAATGAATGAASGAAVGAHGAAAAHGHTTNPLGHIIYTMASPYFVYPGGGGYAAQTTTTWFHAPPLPPPPPPPPMPVVTNTVTTTTYLTGGFAPQAPPPPPPPPGPVTYYPVQVQQVQQAPQVVNGYAYMPGGTVLPNSSVVGAAPPQGAPHGPPPMVVCVAP